MERNPDRKFSLGLQRPVKAVAVLALGGVLLAIFAPQSILLAYLAILLCVLIGLSLAVLGTIRSTEGQPRLLRLLLGLSRDREISAIHHAIAEALVQLADRRDPIFRNAALQRLKTIGEQCKLLGEGTIEFTTTESWRVVYEELLRSPGLHLYRSVAYVETPHYWQDSPGQQSTRLNLELHDKQVLSIERTAIIADHLWPESSLFPVEPLHSWLDEQHRHGIWIRLVRESDLGDDLDLAADVGIYGHRAVGSQIVDASGRTTRFVLSFDFEKVKEAEVQWSRLAVYAISYRELLDQQH
jgi:hypothetical protein